MDRWRAYAKINLCLEVLGRRRDGYHNVTTVLQTVDLHDILTYEVAETLSLRCSDPALETEDNLVLRAARLLQRVTGQTAGASIHLEKRIPVGAGLGGGSSDAAATLVALSSLWGLQMTEANLQNLGAALGSDVPFFLVGGTAVAEGRGEMVTPLPPLAPHWAVIVVPSLQLPDKTSLMYSRLTPREYTTGSVTQHLARRIRNGESLEIGLIFNAFEWVAFRHFEQIDLVRQRVVEAGADHVRLCGAGPSLYAIYPQEEAARAMAERLQQEGLDVHLVRTVEGHPTPIEAQGGAETAASDEAAGPSSSGEDAAGEEGELDPCTDPLESPDPEQG